jgi:hypothetical protein
MNLIEELGLEKCRAIVEGAPEWARAYNTKSKCYTTGAWFYHEILLSDLKAQIDEHYYGQSEEKELEQYALLQQEKIEGGAVFVGDNSKVVQIVRDITDHCSDIRNHISPLTEVIER